MIFLRKSIILEPVRASIVDSHGYCKRYDFSYPLHYHPYTELFVCFEGQMTLLADEEIELYAGDIVLISTLTIHGYRSSGNTTFATIIFNDTLFGDIPELMLFNEQMRVHVLKNLSEEEQTRLFGLMDDVIRFYQVNDDPVTECYSRLLLIFLLRHALRDTSAELALPSDSAQILNQILFEIRSHCTEQFSLSDLEQLVGVNKYTISKLINQSLGSSFVQLLNTCRLQRACRLLTETDETILFIAGEVGFGSVNTFNRNFKEQYHITPTEYRAMSRTAHMD